MPVCISSVLNPSSANVESQFQVSVAWKNVGTVGDLKINLTQLLSDYTFGGVVGGGAITYLSQPKDASGTAVFTITAPNQKGQWYLRANAKIYRPIKNDWIGTDYKDFIVNII